MLFIFGSFDLSEGARCPKYHETQRSLQNDALKSHPSIKIFFIVSYSIIKDISWMSHSSVRYFLMNQSSDLPVALSSGINKENVSTIAFSKGPSSINYRRRFEWLDIDIGQTYNNDRCALDTKTIDFYVASSNHSINETVGITLMHTCSLAGNQLLGGEKKIFVKKSVILLIEGDDNGMDKFETREIFSRNHKMTLINYTIFDEKGFCICNDVLNYIDNCPLIEDKILNQRIFFYFISIFFIMTTVLIKVWSGLKSLLVGRNENLKFKNRQFLE